MTVAIATTWLALALFLSLFAWMASRRLAAILLPMAAILAAGALYVPLGCPIPLRPAPAHYRVIGADIQVDVAIYALLLKDGDTEARYYKLPYSAEQAGNLQTALDGAQNGGPGVIANVGEDGGVAYQGDPPVQGDAPKQVEKPTLALP